MTIMEFYFLVGSTNEDESVSFSDWFTSWLNGEMPEDVWCTDC